TDATSLLDALPICGAGDALMVAIALPALGTVWKFGSKSCGGATPFAYTHSHSSGWTDVRGPGSSTCVFYNYTVNPVHRDTFGSQYGGSWAVAVDDRWLSDPGTYGHCQAFG